MSTATIERPQEIEMVRVAIDMPKRVLDWLERRALERKQAGGGRMAKSPIVVELLEREMALDQGDEP